MSDRLAVSLLALAGLTGCARLEPPPAEAPWFRHTPPADSSGGGITLAPARRGHSSAPAVAHAEAPAGERRRGVVGRDRARCARRHVGRRALRPPDPEPDPADEEHGDDRPQRDLR